MLKVTLSHDADLENPCEFDGWKVYSFGRRHANFRDPDDLGLSYSLDPSTGMPKIMNPGLRTKLKKGLAFFLSYFEHGNCVWFLHGEEPVGVEFRWDGVRVAGLIVWDGKPGDLGPRTLEARRNDADAFLKTYTSWCNGEGYGYSVEDQDGHHVDSCFGFYGADVEYMFDQLRPHLNGKQYEVGGDAAWLANYHLSK